MRKEIVIQIKKFSYKKFETEGLFGPINPNDKAYVELPKKRNLLNEEIRTLKREHEIQSVRLCEVTEQRKKVEETKKWKKMTRG